MVTPSAPEYAKAQQWNHIDPPKSPQLAIEEVNLSSRVVAIDWLPEDSEGAHVLQRCQPLSQSRVCHDEQKVKKTFYPSFQSSVYCLVSCRIATASTTVI